MKGNNRAAAIDKHTKSVAKCVCMTATSLFTDSVVLFPEVRYLKFPTKVILKLLASVTVARYALRLID